METCLTFPPDFYPVITCHTIHVNPLFSVGRHLIINEKSYAEDLRQAESDGQVLIPRNFGVTSHGTRGFAEEVRLRILKWGDFPGFGGQVRCNHRVLRGGRQKITAVGGESVKGIEVGATRGRGHSPRDVGSHQKLGKARVSLRGAEGTRLCRTLVLRLLTSRLSYNKPGFVLSY